MDDNKIIELYFARDEAAIKEIMARGRFVCHLYLIFPEIPLQIPKTIDN